MANVNAEYRRSIPIIYVRGTHYEVGFEIGRTFKSMIQDYVNIHNDLNTVYLPLWETPAGKEAYESTLDVVMQNYPQYIEEMRGTAEGAQVPFHKIFLLHMDDILPCSVENKTGQSTTGCSTVYFNYPDEVFLGHNEDATPSTFNHFYFVSAHIIEEEPMGRWNVKEEKFTSLCYAGTLPGYTMSYNQHGLVHSVNVIRVKDMQAGKTPRTILTRALLAAENLSQVKDILIDPGTGIGDGVNINLIFAKDESETAFYNIEVVPSKFPETDSLIDVLRIGPGEKLYHCNRLLRINCQEPEGHVILTNSLRREAAMNSLPVPKIPIEAGILLGDESDEEFPVYRNHERVQTIATGIFDLKKLIWSVYSDNPKTTNPLFELPISF